MATHTDPPDEAWAHWEAPYADSDDPGAMPPPQFGPDPLRGPGLDLRPLFMLLAAARRGLPRGHAAPPLGRGRGREDAPRRRSRRRVRPARPARRGELERRLSLRPCRRRPARVPAPPAMRLPGAGGAPRAPRAAAARAGRAGPGGRPRDDLRGDPRRAGPDRRARARRARRPPVVRRGDARAARRP